MAARAVATGRENYLQLSRAIMSPPSLSLSLSLLVRHLLFARQPPRDLLFEETIPRSANYRLKMQISMNINYHSGGIFNNSRSRS